MKASEILGPTGPLAEALDTYEVRPQQLEMADAVEAAMAGPDHLLVEAGTGVGKSFAYLVPAIQAVAERSQRVIISTYTISLQEQLIGKDLPFLAGHMEEEFTAVLGKGRGNYLCMRRLEMLCKRARKLIDDDRQISQLERLASWATHTETGSYQDISFPVAGALWVRVCSDANSCIGSKCPLKGQCFFQAARRKMLAADIVVVNHALFFSDLALRDQEYDILGDYDLVVLDEAHTVEGVACDHLGTNISSMRVHRTLTDLYDGENNRGLLALAGDTKAITAALAATSAAEALFEDMSRFAAGSRSGRIHLAPGEELADPLTPAINDLVRQLARLAEHTESDDERAELVGAGAKLAEHTAALRKLIAEQREDHAYWVTLRRVGRSARARHDVIIACAPIEAGPFIRASLFDRVNSVTLTSATLTTGRAGHAGFEYVRQRLGLDEGAELQLDSPFDYREQAKLYIESMLGDPNNLGQFVPAATDAISHYVAKSEGRCFVLFTSYAMLTAVAEAIGDFCVENEYTLLVQGGDLSRSALLDHFRTGSRCILFGTVSFWQGVDVAGEALGNVIITKLPFAAPDSPLVEARIDAIRDRKGSPFMEYQLPEAIIRFRQGFGRLIRSRSDTGFVVVLDHRIVTKRYGRQFIASLPPIDVVRDEWGRQSM